MVYGNGKKLYDMRKKMGYLLFFINMIHSNMLHHYMLRNYRPRHTKLYF